MVGIPPDYTLPPAGTRLGKWLNRWNTTDGAEPVKQLARQTWEKLVRLLNDPGWRWDQVLKKFPLPHFASQGQRVAIGKFIEDGSPGEQHFVNSVLDGNKYTNPFDGKNNNGKHINAPHDSKEATLRKVRERTAAAVAASAESN